MNRFSAPFFLGLTFFLSCNFSYALSPLNEAEDRRDLQAPALQEALHSPHPELRASAAEILGRLQKKDALPFLLSLLNDREISVQKSAVFALGQYGWGAEFSEGQESLLAQKLSEKLSSPNRELRRLLAEALGKIALTQTPHYVIPLLNDPESKVRAESIVALYRFRLVLRLRDSAQTLPLLEDSEMTKLLALKNDSALVLQKLAFYFSKVKDPRGKALVLSLCDSKNLWTRYYAVTALAKFDSDDILPAAIKALADESAPIRVAALQALMNLKAADTLDPSLRGDPSYHVRSTYAQALGLAKENHENALSKLKGLLLDSSLSVEAQALKSIAQLKDSHSYALIKKYLRNSSWRLRIAAVESSVFLEKNQSQEILHLAGEDSDVRVRTATLEILSAMEGAQNYQMIQKALSSSELSERGTAVSALSSRTENERFSDAHSCYLASTPEKWTELREEIIKLWSANVSEETTLYLKEAVNDPSPSIVALAVSALKKRNIDIVAPALTPLLSFSPYRELRFKRNPKIEMLTTKGTLTLELYYKEAPLHVANMVGFAQEGKYNGLPLHRVVSNFVVQGGDPDKTGWGSAGYSLRAEINLLPFERGSLGMPRSTGFDTGGVQFFINHVPTPHLDGQYTVFGKVIDGIEVLDQLEVGDLILSTTVLK